jgi:hypothetical protein
MHLRNSLHILSKERTALSGGAYRTEYQNKSNYAIKKFTIIVSKTQAGLQTYWQRFL